jgi:hypothetical protein
MGMKSASNYIIQSQHLMMNRDCRSKICELYNSALPRNYRSDRQSQAFRLMSDQSVVRRKAV